MVEKTTARFDRRKFLKTIGAIGGVSLTGCLGNLQGQQGPTTLRYATSTEASLTFQYGQVISSVLDENSDLVKIDPITTPGFTANMQLVQDEEADVGGAFSNTLTFAWKGNGKQGYDEAFKEMAQIHPSWLTNPSVLFSRKDSDIKSLDDFRDRNIVLTPGPKGGGPDVPTEAALEAAGLLDEVKLNYIGFDEQAASMRNGNSDVIAMAPISGVLFNPGWTQVLETVNLRLIPWPDDVVTETVKSPFLSKQVIKSENLNVDVSSHDIPSTFVGMGMAANSLVGSTRLSEDVVYDLIKVVLENSDQIAEEISIIDFVGFDDDQLGFTGLPEIVPFHSGAVKYYKEIGVWNDDFKSHG